MPFSLRVRLDPLPGTARRVVSGVSIGLSSFGTGPSRLASGASAEATLIFHAKFLASARNPDGELREFARLSGTLLREAGTGRLRFRLPPGGDFTYSEPPDDTDLRQELRVAFDADLF